MARTASRRQATRHQVVGGAGGGVQDRGGRGMGEEGGAGVSVA
jgi:hypothetical protein